MNRLLPCAFSLLMLFCPLVDCAEVVVTNHDNPTAAGDKMRDAKKISELRLDSGNGHLIAVVKTPGNQFVDIAGSEAVITGKLFGLAVDSDSDDSTGGSARFVSSVTGVELQATIDVCAEVEGKPDAPECVHGFWGQDLAGAHSRVTIRDLVDSAGTEVSFIGGKIKATDDAVRVEIPYAQLGVDAGDTVRIYLLGSQANGVYGPLGEPATVALR